MVCIIMTCPAFIIIFIYNNSIIISVIKHTGEDFLLFVLFFVVSLLLSVFLFVFNFYSFGGCLSFFGGGGGVAIGSSFFLLNLSCMQTYDFACFVFSLTSFFSLVVIHRSSSLVRL